MQIHWNERKRLHSKKKSTPPGTLSYITIILGIVFYLDFPSRQRNGEDRLRRAFNDWASLTIEFKRPMPEIIFKRNLNRF